ncbi:hypothetical protein ACPPVU_08935 [Mucilaginibacter sp. McL0603]|uniref:hypothetical protein n=1 Tax=Mucilaginibacter sp. McL0603 TaxID=3415670 RepID=UPI003CF847F5
MEKAQEIEPFCFKSDVDVPVESFAVPAGSPDDVPAGSPDKGPCSTRRFNTSGALREILRGQERCSKSDTWDIDGNIGKFSNYFFG